MIAQISVYPIGEGTSVSRFVKKGVSVIENRAILRGGRHVHHCGDTGLDELFDLIKKVHAAHIKEEAKRIIIDLKVDDSSIKMLP
jgi:uncharacterized protein YqgV (UPF0045/DUF77 family)